MSPRISIIVAVSENRVIGRDNDLPWHLPADLKHFLSTTRGHTVIMGRKTFESLQQPLTNRPNIIITRDRSYHADSAAVTHSLREAIDTARTEHPQDDELFILGGSAIFREALDIADRMYFTLVHATVEGDVLFPQWDETQWTLTQETHHPADDRHAHAMSFRIYDRIKSHA